MLYRNAQVNRIFEKIMLEESAVDKGILVALKMQEWKMHER